MAYFRRFLPFLSSREPIKRRTARDRTDLGGTTRFFDFQLLRKKCSSKTKGITLKPLKQGYSKMEQNIPEKSNSCSYSHPKWHILSQKGWIWTRIRLRIKNLRPLLACNYPLLQAKSGLRMLIRGCLDGELAYHGQWMSYWHPPTTAQEQV